MKVLHVSRVLGICGFKTSSRGCARDRCIYYTDRCTSTVIRTSELTCRTICTAAGGQVVNVQIHLFASPDILGPQHLHWVQGNVSTLQLTRCTAFDYLLVCAPGPVLLCLRVTVLRVLLQRPGAFCVSSV